MSPSPHDDRRINRSESAADDNRPAPRGTENSEYADEVDEPTRFSEVAQSPEKPASPDANDDEPGTIDQKPRWEGPAQSRPRGYLPAKDDPEVDRDAAGENLADPEKSDVGDALKTRGDP
jgi:hypothetical protein